MYKIYIKVTPVSEWVYKGIAKDLSVANRLRLQYESRGCYTKIVEVVKK